MSIAIAMQYENKQMALSEQWLGKHILAKTNMHTTIGEWWFRCGLHQGVIKKTTGEIQLVEGWQFS
jgi:hypothetical protein